MRAALLALIILGMSAVSARAQDIRGHLQGRVLDSGGAPVATTQIIVRSPDLQGERSAVSDRNGNFVLRWLPVGQYEVELRRIGYEAHLLEGIVIRLGRTTTVGEVRLAETPIELETITARAERLLVDPESTAGGVNLTPALFENLPVDRDYRALITLAPAADEYRGRDLSLAGGTGPETKFFVEGADVTDPVVGTEPTRLPYNFVREVEIKTGGYEAEYRSSLGGISNVVTYSGSNQFQSQVFGFYTSDRLEGDPRFGKSEETLQSSAQYDIGVTLGGPVLRDRLWFFAAWNPSVVTEDVAVPEFGVYDDRSVQHIFAGKLTWRAAESTNLFFTSFGDPGKRDVVQPMSISTAHFTPLNPETWLGEESSGSIHFVVGGTQLIGGNGLIEASFSTMNRDQSYMPISEAGFEVQYHDYPNQEVSGGTTKYGETELRRSNLNLKTTWELGRHSLKAGGEYSTSSRNRESYTAHVIKKFAEDRQRDQLTIGAGNLENRVGGLFVQDSWQVSERWRANLGLRWEAQALLDTNGTVAQTINDQWAPRLGFIFQPGRLGTQRIYGSAGRFYQDLLLRASGYYDGETAWLWQMCQGDPRDEATACEVMFEGQGEIAQGTEGLQGQHFDELALGYERQFGSNLKVGARGVYRSLRRAIEDGSVDDEGSEFVLGNPGYGALDVYPSASREYLALELTAERTLGRGLMLVGSYVLSRSSGNYGGLFDFDYVHFVPNTSSSFDYPAGVVNSDGLLPQDRRHTLKLSASYMTGFGLAIGTRFLWQTGTPLSVRGQSENLPDLLFLEPRGSLGSTPNIWDLDLRFVYDLQKISRRSTPARLVLDLFNIGSPRQAVAYDQICCFTVTEEGERSDPNPNYLQPTRYQPPMLVRLGIELGF